MSQKSTSNFRVAIIGGGVAGVACAYSLRKSGLKPVIFEKSRGLGGRLATRRTAENIHFDHGAQYFTIRDPAFAAFSGQNEIPKIIDVWAAKSQKPATTDAQYVGVPTMNGWLKHRSKDMDIRLNHKVGAITETPEDITLEYEFEGKARSETFDAVIITAPPPQIKDMIGPSHALCVPLAGVSMAPCWTVMATFKGSSSVFDSYQSTSSPLAWLARNSSKPAREGAPQAWVGQASADWSQTNLELSREEVLAQLLPAMCQKIGATAQDVSYQTAHRWRYAKVTQAAAVPHIANAASGIILAGDWCLGPRVECAFQSGQSAATHLINSIES